MDALTGFRLSKDEFFRESHQSPLPHIIQQLFTGLRYYDPNPDLVFTLPVTDADGSVVQIGTTDGNTRMYRRAATVRFSVQGQEVELTLFDTGHPGWFLPFRDATSGKTTYGAGRYLDLEPAEDDQVTIDFNYAYNPFCAYDDAYSCPLPPSENWLSVPIEAGELTFPGT